MNVNPALDPRVLKEIRSIGIGVMRRRLETGIGHRERTANLVEKSWRTSSLLGRHSEQRFHDQERGSPSFSSFGEDRMFIHMHFLMDKITKRVILNPSPVTKTASGENF